MRLELARLEAYVYPTNIVFLCGFLADFICNSSRRVRKATHAAMDLRYSRTVTLPIPTAARVMMRALTGRT
jgi:hypothetical protein